MKNALLVYSDKYQHFNIGDYIQSLAAKQFFENIDVFICREGLNQYVGEDVRIILNGWFTHDVQNWPPSENIHPLFVSFHINSTAQEKLTDWASIEYLMKHAPIGCRDKYTLDLLKNKGVSAFFTGCLTLTLGKKYKRDEIDKTIYFVDPYFKYSKDIIRVFDYYKNINR
ncbi:MAG: polysaccharide pyruvyl transferase family protein [Chlorobiaceae bacterium]